jgi:hypothetical protein
MFTRFANTLKWLVFLGIMGLAALLFYIYSGWYQIGADVPHHKVTYWMLETLRENSIKAASSSIEIPSDIDSPERLLRGGPDYNEMCVSCHLSPNLTKTDFSIGLYPAPPNLTDYVGESLSQTERRQAHFWVIKHGIKGSAMPSWAPGHDDERIWDMVAFIERLPELSVEQYQILTQRASGSSNHHH